MTIRIHVTKEILKASAMCEGLAEQRSSSCAVALAVRDIFPKAQVFQSIFPFGYRKGFEHPEQIYMPAKANNFIYRFDVSSPEQRITMEPVSFEIDVPEAVVEKIGITEIERILSESKTLEKV